MAFAVSISTEMYGPCMITLPFLSDFCAIYFHCLALIWLVQACSKRVFQAGKAKCLPRIAYRLAAETHIDLRGPEVGGSGAQEAEGDEKERV